MADLASITLPNNITYNFKDSGAVHLAGTETITGIKTFGDYIIIDSTDDYPSIRFNFDGTPVGRIQCEDTSVFSFVEGSETYSLPAPTGSSNYDILTSKNPVTIAQGGTGATTFEGAINNIFNGHITYIEDFTDPDEIIWGIGLGNLWNLAPAFINLDTMQLHIRSEMVEGGVYFSDTGYLNAPIIKPYAFIRGNTSASIRIQNNSSNLLGLIQLATASTSSIYHATYWYLRQYGYNSSTGAISSNYEEYRLPLVTAGTTTKNYEILTTKKIYTKTQTVSFSAGTIGTRAVQYTISHSTIGGTPICAYVTSISDSSLFFPITFSYGTTFYINIYRCVSSAVSNASIAFKILYE